jgi:hypothetical protein
VTALEDKLIGRIAPGRLVAGARLLLASHSSRTFFEERVRLNFLNERFESRDRRTWPAFEAQESLDRALALTGALTIWLLDSERPSLELLLHHAPDYKVQSAAFVGDDLAVLGADRIDVVGPDLKVMRTIRDGWLAGAHMIRSCGPTQAWVTAAASDSLLLVDLAAGKVVERLPMPDIYGPRYAITPDSDLTRHFISTDRQATHINNVDIDAATGELLVSLWIPGAIGIFDRERRYAEIARGYRGLHGARFGSEPDSIVFADSISGLVYIIDRRSGAVRRRIDCGTRWLHDAVELAPGILAAAIGDRNEIRLVNSQSGGVFTSLDCGEFGRSVNLLATSPVPAAWQDQLARSAARLEARAPYVASSPLFPDDGAVRPLPDYIAPSYRDLLAAPGFVPSVTHGVGFRSADPIRFERMATLGAGRLAAGTYELAAQATLRKGRVSFSLLDEDRQQWAATAGLEPDAEGIRITFTLDRDADTRLFLCAHNSDRAAPVHVEVHALGLAARDGRAGHVLPPPAVYAPLPPADLRRPGFVPVAGALDEAVAALLEGGEDVRGGGRLGVAVRTPAPVAFDQLAVLGTPLLPKGRYRLAAEVQVARGFLTLGLLDEHTGRWVAQLLFDPAARTGEAIFELEEETDGRLALTANNSDKAAYVEAELLQLVLAADARQTGGESLRLEPRARADMRAIMRAWHDGGAAGRRVRHLWDPRLVHLIECETGPAAVLAVTSDRDVQYEQLLEIGRGALGPGDYELRASGGASLGAVTIAVRDEETDAWLAQVDLVRDEQAGAVHFRLAAEGEVAIVACANNALGRSRVRAAIESLALIAHTAAAALVPPRPRPVGEAVTHLWDARLAAMLTGTLPGLGLALRSAAPLSGEELVRLGQGPLPAGRYELRAEATVNEGAMAIGAVDAASGRWLAQATLSGLDRAGAAGFTLAAPTDVAIVASAANAGRPGPVAAMLEAIALYCSEAGAGAVAQPRCDGTPVTHLWDARLAAMLSGALAGAGVSLRSTAPMTGEEMLRLGRGALQPGRYELTAEATVLQGAVAVGIIDAASGERLAQIAASGLDRRGSARLELPRARDVAIIVSAANAAAPGPVAATLDQLALRRLSDGAAAAAPPKPRQGTPVEHLWDARLAAMLTGALAGAGVSLRSAAPLTGEEMARLGRGTLAAGCYEVHAEATVLDGALAVGVIDAASGAWLAPVALSGLERGGTAAFTLTAPAEVAVVVSAANAAAPGPVVATLDQLALRRLSDGAAAAPPKPRQGTPVEHLWDARLAAMLTGALPGAGISIVGDRPLTGEEMLRLGRGRLAAGEYALDVAATVQRGAVAAGVIDASAGTWLAHARLTGLERETCAAFTLAAAADVAVILAASNTDGPAPVTATLARIALLARSAGGGAPPGRP